MGEASITMIGAGSASDATLTGQVEASLFELVDGQRVSSRQMIRSDRDWIVHVEWSIEGALASCICGEWALHLYMEAVGQGPEFHFPQEEDLHIPLNPCQETENGRYQYSYDIQVPAGTIRDEHYSSPYKPIVAITYRDICKRPGPVAGFVELPTMQFYASKSRNQSIGDSAYDESAGHQGVQEGTASTLIHKSANRQERRASDVTLTSGESDILLTPSYLEKTIVPYLAAIEQLQHTIDKITGSPTSHVHVRSIKQYSPISVDLGGASQAVEVIRDEVVPWRRKHGRKIADQAVELNESERQLREQQARKLKAEADIEEVESSIAALKAEAELERLQLENDRLRIQNEKLRIELALQVIERFNPHMGETDKIRYTVELLEPLGVLSKSPLPLTPAENSEAEN